jgi:acyl carrier protein
LSVRTLILEKISEVAARQGKALAPLHDDLHLLNSGLDSLCVAILVASLDDALGIDPFVTDADVPFPVTIGDFISLYENARV